MKISIKQKLLKFTNPKLLIGFIYTKNLVIEKMGEECKTREEKEDKWGELNKIAIKKKS